MPGWQAWEWEGGGGRQSESYHEHIVIKLKISEHSLARGITVAMRAIIIGSENMRNCLQLAFFYSWHCWGGGGGDRRIEYAACFTMAVVIEIWYEWVEDYIKAPR